MYVGWALLHLGVGVLSGSAWVVATLPPAAGLVHGQVIKEERALAAGFGDDFAHYRAAAPRYFLGGR
jgi:protein-S-isoprenylcysteine O-methyltransferase Ste14